MEHRAGGMEHRERGRERLISKIESAKPTADKNRNLKIGTNTKYKTQK